MSDLTKPRKPEQFYKITDPETGLFSTGGSDPKWTKKGKIWRTLGALKNHLNIVQMERWVGPWSGQRRREQFNPYEGCQVVLCEVREVSRYDVQVHLDEKAQREADRKAKEEADRKARQEERERAELARLQKKYGANP